MEFLKGTVGDLNPVEEVCPLKAIFFGKDFEVVFKKYETECPKEWSSNQGCWRLWKKYECRRGHGVNHECAEVV
jgi:formate hydrogenlyase subunit 6/NADH:ubiquinone oxidoreductase subunit I